MLRRDLSLPTPTGLAAHFQNAHLVWVDDNRALIPIDQPLILASHPQTFLAAPT